MVCLCTVVVVVVTLVFSQESQLPLQDRVTCMSYEKVVGG